MSYADYMIVEQMFEDIAEIATAMKKGLEASMHVSANALTAKEEAATVASKIKAFARDYNNLGLDAKYGSPRTRSQARNALQELTTYLDSEVTYLQSRNTQTAQYDKGHMDSDLTDQIDSVIEFLKRVGKPGTDYERLAALTLQQLREKCAPLCRDDLEWDYVTTTNTVAEMGSTFAGAIRVREQQIRDHRIEALRDAPREAEDEEIWTVQQEAWEQEEAQSAADELSTWETAERAREKTLQYKWYGFVGSLKGIASHLKNSITSLAHHKTHTPSPRPEPSPPPLSSTKPPVSIRAVNPDKRGRHGNDEHSR